MNEREIIESAWSLQAQADLAGAENTLRVGLTELPESAPIAAALCKLLCLLTREAEAVDLLPVALECSEGREQVRTLAHYYYLRTLAAEKLSRPDPDSEAALAALKRLASQHEIQLSRWPELSLTAALITKNEAGNIRACLESVKRICDEIVVVDTGSKDETVEIAKSLGAKTFSFEWTNSFSDARNRALECASSQWVLWIDADERLTPESFGAILAGMVRPQFGGYLIAIQNLLHEQDESQDILIHHACRLFQKLPSVRFEGKIHEQVSPSIVKLGLPIATLEGALIKHYGYRVSAMEANQKHERNIAMLRQAIEENPEDGFQLFNLGNALSVAGEFEEAIEVLERASAALTPNSEYGQLTYQLIAFAQIDLGRPEAAVETCEIAEQKGFGGQLVQYAMAYALHSMGEHERALSAIEIAQSQSLRPTEIGDRTISIYKAKYLEAQIQLALGSVLDAESGFREVLDAVPGFSPAKLSLAVLLRKLGNTEEAFEWAKSITADGDIGDIAADLVLMCATSLHRVPEALEYVETYWSRMPDEMKRWHRWVQAAEQCEDWETAVRAYSEYARRFEPSSQILVNAGRALSNVGRLDVALVCFEDAAAIDPKNANAFLNAGDLLYRVGNYEDAAQAYKAGISLDLQNAQAWFVFGNTLYKLGMPQAACSAFEQAVAIRPTYQEAIANLNTVREELLEIAS